MTSNRKPRCFVAMAFDGNDTDAIYDNAIKTVLRKNGVTPIIINRQEDNRDINHQIIDQLNRADFCIVDLTYTRPSVYFEAGYAQRQIEVIYTVRSDHLKKNQPEHLRVHFDLQMKPLIKWSTPDDPTFAKRLERRLKQTVLRKWKARQQEIETDKHAKGLFLALSTNEKLRRLRSIAIHSLHRKGFDEWCIIKRSAGLTALNRRGLGFLVKYPAELHKRPTQHAGLDATFIARHKTKNHLHVASVFVAESLTQTILRDETGFRFVRSAFPDHLYTAYDDVERAKIRTTEEHHVIICLNNFPSTRIMSAMPNLSFESANNRYSMNVPFTEESRLKIQRQLHFYFLPKVISEHSFREGLAQILGQIPKLPRSRKRSK